jgi:hypothetical protein
MDTSPASDPGIVAAALALVGTAVTALAFALKTLARRKTPPSLRPPTQTPPPALPSTSTQMRAVTETMMRAEQDQRMRAQVRDMHGVLMARDAANEQYRVHNKAHVEQAILDSRRFDERQVELLEQILEAVSDDSSPGRYRRKMPSARGGE